MRDPIHTDWVFSVSERYEYYECFLRMVWPTLGLDRDRTIDKTLFDEDRRVIGTFRIQLSVGQRICCERERNSPIPQVPSLYILHGRPVHASQ